MDRLKRSRTANKRVLNTYKRQVEDELAKDAPSVNTLKTLLELISDIWNVLAHQCQEIQEIIPDADIEDMLEPKNNRGKSNPH